MTPELHIERRGALVVVTLDRPRALNALTHDMVRRLSRGLVRWRDDPEVAAVLVRAVPGRAFCAGGDIRAIVETAAARGVDEAARFFFDEYRMNWRIRHFPKPWIALMDGITMGGGVGISVHGSHRIVTENTLFAMPETGIGFFPDVGGTWFLPRLPGETGMYLGLTGERIGAADCAALGIATACVPQARLAGLEERLAALPADRFRVGLETVLDEFSQAPAEPRLAALRRAIDRCFGAGRFADMMAALAREPGEFGARVLAVLAGKSPLSLRVTFEQLRRGRVLDFDACMQLEYRIVRRFLACGEFAEGVRALIVDKDRQPRWRYRDWREVPEEEVAAFFAPLDGGDLPLDWEEAADGEETQR